MSEVTGRVAAVQGKVRDTYVVGDKLVIVTTDRQSAFDRLLASIPFKVLVLATSREWLAGYIVLMEMSQLFLGKLTPSPSLQQAMQCPSMTRQAGCVVGRQFINQRGQHAGY